MKNFIVFFYWLPFYLLIALAPMILPQKYMNGKNIAHQIQLHYSILSMRFKVEQYRLVLSF